MQSKQHESPTSHTRTINRTEGRYGNRRQTRSSTMDGVAQQSWDNKAIAVQKVFPVAVPLRHIRTHVDEFLA